MDFSAIQSDLTRLSVLRIDGAEEVTLALGREITARVLKIETDGQLLLSVGERKLYAKTQLLLQEGEEIRLKVSQPGPPLELQLLGERVEPAMKNLQMAALLMAWGQRTGTATAADPALFLRGLEQLLRNQNGSMQEIHLQQLQRLLLPIMVGPNSVELQDQLKALLENSGVFFEAKLRTLLETLQKTPDQALRQLSADLKALLGQVEKALQNFRPETEALNRELIAQQKLAISQQLLEQQTEVACQWLKDGSFVAQFPLLFDSQSTQARIRFFNKSGNSVRRDPKAPYSIDIFLELPRLGKLEAWAQWLEQQIEVRLYVENSETRDQLETQLAKLAEGLEKAGFTGVDLEVVVDPIRLFRNGPKEVEVILREGSLLNLTA